MIIETIEIIKYGLDQKKVTFIVFLVTLVAILGAFLRFERTELKLYWDQFADWPISVLTLIIAFSVFVLELRRLWLESLPKKLTVVFTFENNEVMRCNNATLSSEADLRALSQQIGKQIAGGELQLIPMLDGWNKKLSEDKKEMLYEAYVLLWGLEIRIWNNRNPGEEEKLKKAYKDKEKYVWEPSFLAEPKLQKWQ